MFLWSGYFEMCHLIHFDEQGLWTNENKWQLDK